MRNAKPGNHLKTNHFQIWVFLFTNVGGGSFQWWRRIFANLSMSKVEKNRETVYSDSNLISKQLVFVHLWKGVYTTLPKKSIDIKATSQESIKVWMVTLAKLERDLACVASVSMRFRRKKRGTRFKDRAKNGASGSRLISRAIKTENPLPRSLFAPKPNGNACYAG